MTVSALAAKRICSRLANMLVHNSERLGCRRIHRRPIKQRYPAPKRYLLGEGRNLHEVGIAFRELFPDSVETRIHQADLICAHVFDLLGSGPTRLSPPGPSYQSIDWHSDFKSGYRWDPEAFYRNIRFGHEAGVDVKVPWELSRFQHLNTLGQAYVLTGDRKYCAEFENQLDDWICSNPAGFGVNWTCTMDVAIRAANWLLAAEYFLSDGALDTGFLQRLYASIHGHGRFIYRHLERYPDGTTNHYLANIVGLLYIAVCCPFLKESRKWLPFCIRELTREMDGQIHDDGCHFEASTCYHRLALELFFFATLLVVRHERRSERDDYRRAAERVFGPGYTDRLHRMFLAVLHLLKPNGHMPQIGDNDSGRLHVFGSRDGLDMRYLLALGAVFFDEAGFKVKEFGLSEEVLWIFGGRGYGVWKGLEGVSAATIRSRSFSDAGWYVLRRDRDYCLVSCRPDGAGGKGGHAHNDRLSFELVLDGHDVVVDPGTYIYTADPGQRNRFRATDYHNMMHVDGYEQNELPDDDMFSLPDRVRVLRAELVDTDAWIGFEGEIRYAGILHRRTISVDTESGRWRIADRVLCPKPLGGRLALHLSPRVVGRDGYIFEQGGRDAFACIEIEGGHMDVRCYDYSPGYGVAVKAQCIGIRVPDVTAANLVTTFSRPQGGTFSPVRARCHEQVPSQRRMFDECLLRTASPRPVIGSHEDVAGRTETLELLAVGDVSLICPEGRHPFEYVARYLRAGDIVFGNLEGVLCRTGVAAEKETTLRASPCMAVHLRQAGFSILNVANNHALDFGPAGLRRTLAALREQGIRSVGVNDASSRRGCEVIECNGLRVGFLAYCQTDASGRQDGLLINRIDRGVILEHLRGLRTRCDIAVVSLHWGFEYVYYPSPEQIELARDLVAGGAALVLGHHPHVVQGIEEFRGGLIAYSLGGFQFESSEVGMQRSFILRAKISKRGVERYRLVPIQIKEDNRPRLARDEDRRDLLRRLEEISAPVREGRITEKWWFQQMAGVYLSANARAWRTRIRKFGIRHFMQFVRWLVSGFTIKCYLGSLRRRVGLYE